MAVSPAVSPVVPNRPVFPHAEDFARAFYEKATRHLTESHCLHQNKFFAGAITSAMKAGELGAKSVVILENAMGIYENVFKTHKPYTEMENHPLLKRLAHDLETHQRNLSLEIREMEGLEPNLFGKRNFEAAEANTEYPFLIKVTDTGGNTNAIIQSPQQFFDLAKSERYYRIAYDLLSAHAAINPLIGAWNITLPPRVAGR